MTTAEILKDSVDLIILRWLHRVTERLEVAKKEAKPILVNTLPVFILNLAEALTPEDSRRLASENNSIAQEHGGERARLTNYNPEDILIEYQILREIILSVLRSKTKLTDEEFSTIISSIDKATTEAMTNYFLVLTNLREKFSLFMTFEIKKPLASITGKAVHLKYKSHEPSIVKEIAQEISLDVQKIHEMIHNFMDPAFNGNHEKLRMPLKYGDLFECIKSAVHDLESRFGQRFELSGESVKGFWNAHAIKLAVESLCMNVYTYERQHKIEINLQEMFGRALVTIKNPGKFIPPGKQEMIFQSFRRRESTHDWSIGLPLVRGVAEAHGGSIGVDSSREKGTTFVLDILLDSRPYQGSPMTPGTEDIRNFEQEIRDQISDHGNLTGS